MNKTVLLISTLFLSQLNAQTLIKDINLGSESSNPGLSIALDNGFFFYARTKDNGQEPWFSDGTESGTILLKDIQAGAASSSTATYYTRVGNEVYWVAAHSGSFKISLWKTDGTVNGTMMVKDLGSIIIPPGGGSISAIPMIAYNNKLYFVYEDYRGKELWVSDGTANGTDIVKDIQVGQTGSNPTGLTVFKGKLYFFADDGSNGNELWSSDGSTSGTALFKDIYPGLISSLNINAPSLMVFKDMLYFGAQGTHDEGIEVYRTDGTANGTVLFKDINTTVQASSYPAFVGANSNYMIFRATTADEGAEPWVTDGSEQGTKLLTDIISGTGSSYPGSSAVVNGKIVFSTYTSTMGSELWVTDGSTANTELLKDIDTGKGSGYYGNLTLMDNVLYFVGNNTEYGMEIWETDGSPAGTILSKDFNPGAASSEIKSLFSFNQKLYFGAKIANDTVGIELYSMTAQETSVKLLEQNSQVTVYPNPVKPGTSIFISGINDLEFHSAKVFNAKGQLVYSSETSTLSLPEQLPAGVYMLLITTSQGQYSKVLILAYN